MTKRHSNRDYVTGFGVVFIHLGALCAFLPMFFSWKSVGIAVALYLTTLFGISFGYHRLLTHRGFVVPKFIEYIAAFIGTLALEGGPIEWVSQHRVHHAFADHEGDPHGMDVGFFWAHLTWMFRTNQGRISSEKRARWAPDLINDPFYKFLEKSSFGLTVALALVLFAFGGPGLVIWGIFARLVFTYHCTWFVNSAAHSLGYRTFKTKDLSTNNWLVALFTMGEGWHNNHHAFPFSARHGLKWFEYDFTYGVIKTLASFGIVRNVKIATEEMMHRYNSMHQENSEPA